MASDLNDLIINKEELVKLTGISYQNDKKEHTKNFASNPFVIDSYSVSKEIIRPSLVRGSKERENLYETKCKERQYFYGFFCLLPLMILFYPVFIVVVIYYELKHTFPDWYYAPFIYIGSLVMTKSAKRKWKKWANYLQPTPLGTLIDEVYNYNKIVEKFIKNVQVIDQLKEVGNPVEVKDRDKVIKAFRNIKSDLERAIKTEKILRENPDFKPEEFSIDLTFLRAVRFEEKAQTYAEFVNDAIDIGLRVQEEMKNLQNWS